MSRPVRIALIVIGLAAIVYGTASLTGDWLGTPPWWEAAAPMTPREWLRRYEPAAYEAGNTPGLPRGASDPSYPAHPREDKRWAYPAWDRSEVEAPRHVEPRDGREWISGGLVAIGLALAGLGAWPRRRTDVSP